jgi:hypothetical protein
MSARVSVKVTTDGNLTVAGWISSIGLRRRPQARSPYPSTLEALVNGQLDEPLISGTLDETHPLPEEVEALLAPEIPDADGGAEREKPRLTCLPDLLVKKAKQTATSVTFVEDAALLEAARRRRRVPAMTRVNWQLTCWSTSMSKITEASRDHIADENFAFPKERKEPIHDAAHVRNAIARFKQVQGVTEAERDEAWKRIKSAANKHKVELNEQDWRKLS